MAAPGRLEQLASYIFRTWLIFWDVLLQQLWFRKAPSRKQQLEMLVDATRDRTILVTGSTSGIGLEIARALVLAGSAKRLVLAVRNVELANKLTKQWTEEATQGNAASMSIDIEARHLDLASMSSVKDFCAQWQEPLDVLVCNAGIFTMGRDRQETKDGLEVHYQTNFLGHYILISSLQPWLRQAAHPRVVCLSSNMHFYSLDPLYARDDSTLQLKGVPYSGVLAYSQTKLAFIQLTNYMRTREASLPSDVTRIGYISNHPGNVCTNVVRDLPWIVQVVYRWVLKLILLSAEQGATSTIAAISFGVEDDPGLLPVYLYSDGSPQRPMPQALDMEGAEELVKQSARIAGVKSL